MKSLAENTYAISDVELVELVKNGDQKAFSQLVKRYSTAVFRFSYSFLKDVEKAEDITQETFVVLWEKTNLWKPSGVFKSWLFRIARNKCIDEIRAKKSNVDIDKVQLVDGEKNPAEKLFDHQLTNIVDNKMGYLPIRQQEAVKLVHFLDFSNIEAAELMDVSVDALESLLSRGRRKLRALLRDHKADCFGEGKI